MNRNGHKADESLSLLKGLENEIHRALDRLEDEAVGQQQQTSITTGGAERGAAAGQRHLKSIIRACFMSHYAATEGDFERLWPRLRDDYLCRYTLEKFLESADDRP